MLNTFRTTIAAAALLLSGLPAHADLTFHVDLDTSVLMGNANAPYALDFQLNDGQGIGDANNLVTLSNFSFGGGAATATATFDGGGSGTVATGLSISDSSFFNAATQSFTAGSTLGFDVTLSTHVDPGGTPDEFSLAILDGNGNEISTTGWGDPLIVVDIDSSQPTIQTFAGTGAYGAMPAPATGPVISPVPEPATAGLFVAGLVMLLWHRRASAARPTRYLRAALPLRALP